MKYNIVRTRIAGSHSNSNFNIFFFEDSADSFFKFVLPFYISQSDTQKVSMFVHLLWHFVLHETLDVTIVLKNNYPTYISLTTQFRP